MQSRDGETKNDFKELMYVRLFTHRCKRAAMCGKRSMRPTDVHADNFVEVRFGLPQNVAHLNLAANKAQPVHSTHSVNVSFSVSLSTIIKQNTLIVLAPGFLIYVPLLH